MSQLLHAVEVFQGQQQSEIAEEVETPNFKNC